MNQESLISIIIANYNNARYISEALDSIFAQTYKNFEIIIIEDCSTDNSLDVIQEYSKKKFSNKTACKQKK
ncbi:MAG: glycosyltransferase family 2 protein [Chloroflexia bacterium]|nr:glycosyltransferase family 2 protein [Chloroflexia bacterium]